MTRAVEQELVEITRKPWQFLQPSFRNFLLRAPVSATPMAEADAEQQVRCRNSKLCSQVVVLGSEPTNGLMNRSHGSGQQLERRLLDHPGSTWYWKNVPSLKLCTKLLQFSQNRCPIGYLEHVAC